MGRVLSIDYGARRISLAYSDPDRRIVSHVETLTVRGLKESTRLLAEYIKAHEIDLLIVGYPLRQDGTAGDTAEQVDRLVGMLGKAMPEIEIKLADERYTSIMALRYVHEAGRKVGDDKGKVDAAAAGILLEEYLDRESRKRNLRNE